MDRRSLEVAATTAVAAGNLFTAGAQAMPSDHDILRASQEAAMTRVGGHQVNDAGPTLPSGLAAANKALDFVLDAGGPDSCVAVEIGQAMGINGAAARAEYVNPDNIDLVGKRQATDKKYPGETGCEAETPVKVANADDRTSSFTVAAKHIPGSAAGRTHRSGSEFLLKNSVMSAGGENMLLSTGLHLPHRPMTHRIDFDASHGILSAIRQYAAPLERAGSTVVCPDGTIASTASNADAISAALAKIQGESHGIVGKHLAVAKFQAAYNWYLSQAENDVKAAANGPGSADPTCPPGTGPDTPPPPPPPPPSGPYPSGEVGVDLSWPNGGLVPPSVQFGLVGVDGGTVFSDNPYLEQQASYFTNLTLYANTGWYSESSHLDPTYPIVCVVGDLNCEAYDYGYAAAVYAYNLAASKGIFSDKWMSDLEPPGVNTWSDDVIQNQNSLKGEHDAFDDLGATTNGVYGTTYAWNALMGASFKPDWDEWGATIETTAEDAELYCAIVPFTGGKILLIQFLGRTSSGEPIDMDYAC